MEERAKTEAPLSPPIGGKPNAENTEKKKLTNKERNEFRQLEKDIAKLEAEKETLTEKINNGIADHKEMMECSQRIGEIISALESKELRWIDLSE